MSWQRKSEDLGEKGNDPKHKQNPNTKQHYRPLKKYGLPLPFSKESTKF